MKKAHILFDLDGTIIDSSEGIFNSINYAMKKLVKEELSLEVLKTFVGPPLQDSFERIGLSEENAALAVTYYRELYSTEGIYQAKPYDEIEKTLAELSKCQKLYLATSKPEFFAKKILEHLGFTEYFTGIYGADLEGLRIAKADVIAYALRNAKLEDKETIVMIGDREHDILGAKINSVDSIGVLYGFGSQKELSQAGADEIIEKPEELLSLVRKG